ncbi:MAG: hypothetical protein OWS74_00910 [Firmicutes bacterium]|nr:hypothetical protein [Bacillota bacterium]
MAAEIRLEANNLEIHLHMMDEILSLHGKFTIPYAHITSVSADPVPEEWWRGFHVIGTRLPFLETAGTFHTKEGKIFYDFHNSKHCLTFDVKDEAYVRIIVEVEKSQDPQVLAKSIALKLADKNPAAKD